MRHAPQLPDVRLINELIAMASRPGSFALAAGVLGEGCGSGFGTSAAVAALLAGLRRHSANAAEGDLEPIRAGVAALEKILARGPDRIDARDLLALTDLPDVSISWLMSVERQVNQGYSDLRPRPMYQTFTERRTADVSCERVRELAREEKKRRHL